MKSSIYFEEPGPGEVGSGGMVQLTGSAPMERGADLKAVERQAVINGLVAFVCRYPARNAHVIAATRVQGHTVQTDRVRVAVSFVFNGLTIVDRFVDGETLWVTFRVPVRWEDGEDHPDPGLGETALRLRDRMFRMMDRLEESRARAARLLGEWMNGVGKWIRGTVLP